MDEDLNIDIDPNAAYGPEEWTQEHGEIAKEVEIPESTARQGFEGIPDGTEQEVASPESLFDQNIDTVGTPVVLAEKRPVATMLTAMSTGDPYENPVLKMGEANLRIAQSILDSQQEEMVRRKIASDRQMDTLIHIEKLRKQSEALVRDNALDPRVTQGIDETYQAVLNNNIQRDSRIAMEYETIGRIQDALLDGDYAEAKVITDLHTNGNAEQRMFTEMGKQLIMAQRLEELEEEYKDSGWVRYIANIASYLIPLRSNFDRSGIMDDAGIYNDATGIMNFIFSGDNLQLQGESLWNLPAADFAKAMAKDGPVMRAIRDNAGLFINDPGAEMAILKNLSQLSEDDKTLENVFGALDPLLIGGFGASKVTKLLTGMGARSVATDQAARALLETINKGSEGAKATTGLGLDDVIENINPSALSPNKGGVSLGTDIISSLRTAEELRKTLPEIVGTSKFTSPDEILEAYKSQEKILKGVYGDSVKDVKYIEVDPGTGARVEFAGEVAEGVKLHQVEVTIGKKTGGGFASEAPAKGSLTKFGIDDGVTFKDESGQWFAKFNVAVKEDGFITSPLITPEGNILSAVRSTSRIIDPTLMGKALQAGNAANRFNTVIEKTIKLSLKGLSGGEKKALDQVIRKGQNKAVWYNKEDFAVEYERLTGRLPTDDVYKTYSTYRTVSDLTYLYRNDAIYAQKYAQGQRAVKFEIGPQAYDGQGIINYNPKKRIVGGIYDAQANRFLSAKITPKQIKSMVDEGYVLVKLDTPHKLPNKKLVHNVMVKSDKLRTSDLKRFQLNYSQGGSRAYTARYFAKQTMKDVDGNLINPRTFIAGKNVNEMKVWVGEMNKAIELARTGVKDPAMYDDIFQGRKGFPTGEEFVENVNKGAIDLKHNMEVVYHGEMPSAYRGLSDEGLRYVDMEETALEGYAKSHGQMFYSEKGAHLKDYTGEFAETIDPWETLNRSIQEVGRTLSFSGYKQNALERLKKTYGAFLQLKDVDSLDSLYSISKAAIKNDVPQTLRRQIKAEQDAVARILNFETQFERSAREYTRSVAEWTLGLPKGERLQDAVYWLEKNNPVQALRSIAFDAKLGLFNIGQFFVQSSTMISATALSPRFGMKGMMTSAPLFSWAHLKYSDAALDVLAKRGVWKSGGFASEQEFKEYARYVKDTGLLEVSGTNLSMVNEYGANRIFGLASKKDAFLEAGRIPFYSAEKMNRLVSSRIAWGLNMEKGLKPGTAAFRESFMRLSDDYSMNMMSQSAARFQHGLLSIPTQFWGYSFRMMDALLGSRFTPAQRLRLLTANFAMAGAAGVPLGSLVTGLYEEMTGETTQIDNVDGWLDRGLIDGMVYATTGADVEIGAKVGTSDMLNNLFLDIFGMGKYGEKSFGEFVAGATGSIVMSAAPTLGKALYYSASEASGEVDANISEDTWIAVGREISTLNYAHNAYYAAMYGVYKSKSGTVYASNLPEETAFFSALGFQPRQVSDAADLMEKSSEDKVIEEGAKIVTNWRQEAFTIPDKYEDNRRKVQAYLAPFPAHVRMAILERASKVQDKSLYERLARKHEEDMQKQKGIELIENAGNPTPEDPFEEEQIEGNNE